MRKAFLSLVLILVASQAASALERGSAASVEAIDALKEATVSDQIKGAVEEKGWRVTGDDGKALVEVWFAKKVNASGSEVMGANFGNIPEGTFLGVIRFLADSSDYRGQALKAGYYTMRYMLILQNGAHLGVSPTRDFFLLGKVADDKDPVQKAAPDVVKMSTVAAGSGHPSAWNIVLPTSKDGSPKLVKTDEGHVILEANVGGQQMGLTLIGKTEG